MADLTTWTKVKAALDLEDAQQTEAERFIAVASDRAEHYTSRVLAASDLTMQYDGNGKKLLMLNSWPVNSVTSVHVDQELEFGDETEVEDYKVREDIGAIYRRAGWPAGESNIQVVANVGYSDIPEDLEESIIQLVGYWIESPQVGWISNGNAENGNYQTRYIGAGDLPFQVRQVWDLYRKVHV